MPFLDLLMFASGDSDSQGWLTSALVASLITNLGQLIVTVATVMRQKRRDTVGEYELLLRRHERMVDRHETEIDSLNRMVAVLSQRCSECDTEAERMYSFIRILHGLATRQAEAIAELGGHMEPVPKLPPLPKRKYPEADFLQRTAAQIAASGRAADKVQPYNDIELPKDEGPAQEPENEGTAG